MDIIKQFFKGRRQKSISGYTLSDLFTRGGGDLENAVSFYPQYEKSLYVYACVKKIAQKVSSVDYKLYQLINSDGDTKEIKNHKLLDLLYAPNPKQTKREFIELWEYNKLLTGEAFIWKITDSSGDTVEMYHLRPDRMEVVNDKAGDLVGYRFRKTPTDVVNFSPEEIIFDKNVNPNNPERGMSPVRPASSRVQTEEYANAFQRDFFRNNARPDAILKVNDYLKEQAKKELEEKWDNKYMGTGKGSKLAILEAGLEYQQVAVTQREMDYIESLKFTRDDILVAFQVPKPIVAITDQVNYANAKTAMEIFQRETVLPEVLNICEVLNERLVYPDFDVRLQLSYENFIAEDRELTLKEYEKGLMFNYLTINEVRMREGLDPITGGWSIYMPFSMTPVGGIQQNKDVRERIELDQKSIDIITQKYRNPASPRLRVNKKARYLLETMEKIKREVTQEVKTELKKISKKKAVQLMKLFEDPALRQNYYDTVNKKLDNKALPFSEAIKEYMSEQESRVLDEFNSQKSITKDLATSILDKKKEGKVFAELSLPFLRDYFESAGEEALSSLAPAEEFNMTSATLNAIKDRAGFLARSVTETTIDKLASVISQGLADGKGNNEIADDIRSLYAEMPTYRADMIARTEATNANNMGLVEGYKQSGIATHKEWVATMDGRTRDEHLEMNKETVPVDDTFSNGLFTPSEPNCRCVIAPVIRME